MNIKIRCPYFNNGMSYKVISEKTYNKLVRKGQFEKNQYAKALRYFGEHPVGSLKSLDEKFGRDFVDGQLITGSNIFCLSSDEANRNRTYLPGNQLAFRLNIRGLANTMYYDETSAHSHGHPPNIFQQVYRCICDLIHPPKIIDRPPEHYKQEE